MKEIALYILDIAQNSISAKATLVELTLSETPEAITFTIVDNGRGMSPELMAQVSDPFTTTRTTRKMGLGIPLLRMAVEQTGGSLTIDSTEGVGTTVTALFRPAHIDCPPVGDMAGTITLLLQGTPQLELHYVHTIDKQPFPADHRGAAGPAGTRDLPGGTGGYPLDQGLSPGTRNAVTRK